jgi:hypothetical protein
MPRRGEHEIDLHPRGAWRALVAGCVAVGLLVLGLIVGAHAQTPSPTPAVGTQVDDR